MYGLPSSMETLHSSENLISSEIIVSMEEDGSYIE